MDTQTFLDNFATIADAPGGIDRLRSLILDLAVRGQLVEQRSEEQGITSALEAKRSEIGPVVKAKVPGRPKVPRVPEEWEQRHDAPPGWEWARIDDTGSYVNGLAFNQHTWTNEGTPIIRIQNLTNPSAEFNYAEGPFPDDRMVEDGDILVSWSATLEAFVWDRGPAVVNQHIFKVIPDNRIVDSNFLFHLLRSSIRILADGDAAHGLVMKHINRGPFVTHPVAIPPLVEQRRIVAKVNELMALCDELEEAQQQREHTTTLARTSALHALTTAETDTDRADAWARVAGNWDSITNPPFSVADLRSHVMDLAARGQLVAQASDEGSASELVQQIAEHELVSPSDLVKEISAEDEPWDLPASWKWVRLKSIADFKAGKTPATKNPGYWSSDGGIRWATIADMVAGGSILTTERAVTDRAAAEVFRHDPAPAGTILMSFKLTIGKVARLGAPSYFNEAIVSIKSPLEITDEFLFRFLPLLAPLGGSKAAIKGKTLNKSSISNVLIPLPPLAEQRRIVAKVDELMELCDTLEAVHNEVQSSAAHLAESLSSGQLVS
jgi:type I restriction enzyme S subunit